MDRATYLIAWDNASKRFPFRVVTTSGLNCGYFRSFTDAVAYCEGK